MAKPMVAIVRTVSYQGMDVQPIDVEVQISSGLPAFTVVGLPDKAVAESRERVRGALTSLGLSLPAKKLTVNLAPADVLKEGSHYDLPIALGVLIAMQILPQDAVDRYIVLGEMGLDSGIRACSGVLPAAVYANAIGFGLICPAATGSEAAWAGEMDILAPLSLLQFLNHVKGVQVMTPPAARLPEKRPSPLCMSDVKGQKSAKRALEIAASGGHNVLMIGPPGSGKSMLAARLPTLMPALSPAEALELSMIHSLAGTLPEGGLITDRPFRDPHHSASLPSLIGGGTKAKPGEISLAHHGVLFLDELPEFARGTLESLRQPMETGQALVARVQSHVTFPARFQLVAAMNPCRCGYLDDPARACRKAPHCGADYQSKISGPLLDRFDLFITVGALSYEELSQPDPDAEPSPAIRRRVEGARTRQAARFAHVDAHNALNGRVPYKMIEEHEYLTPDAKILLDKTAPQINLSARGLHRVLRVARTIADLDACLDPGVPSGILPHHLAEALGYRQRVTAI